MEEAPYDPNNFLLVIFKARQFVNRRILELLKLVAIIKAIKEDASSVNKVLDSIRDLMFPWEKSAAISKGENLVKRLEKYKNNPLLIKKVGN